jgi:hypothetical protein
VRPCTTPLPLRSLLPCVTPELTSRFVNPPRFVNYARKNAPTPLDPTAFYNGVKALQAQHLGATLRLLSPVNNLNIYGVSLTTAN